MPKKSAKKIEGEIQDHLASTRSSHPRLTASRPKSEAVKFFLRNTGYARKPGESAAKAKKKAALDLARAEMIAEDRGWIVTWEEDTQPWDGDEKPFEVLVAVLRDSNGNAIESLGNIGMTGNRLEDLKFKRLTEAELALQAMSRL